MLSHKLLRAYKSVNQAFSSYSDWLNFGLFYPSVLSNNLFYIWRGVRVVEGGSLENC